MIWRRALRRLIISCSSVILTLALSRCRFLSIDVDTVNAVTLEDAKNAVMSQLIPSDIEITVSGDFVVNEVLDMILKYLGTVPANANIEYKKHPSGGNTAPDTSGFSGVPTLLLPGKHLDLELEDSDPRAVAYVAGELYMFARAKK